MRRLRTGIAILLCALAALSASGCATLPDGRGWGEGATLAPGWERVRQSAADAARDPRVWVPLAGAAVFRIGDWDHQVSDWARRRTPVFGSAENAARWSDRLRTASGVAYAATALSTPSGDAPDEWFRNKAKGVAVGLAARGATSIATQALKRGVGRERPDGSNDQSFPSGHTSASAVNTMLASRNLRAIRMPDRARRGLDIGLATLTVGTSWARIEAGVHYPSDTLFGMALGNFLGAFLNDAFLGIDPGARSSWGIEAVPGGMELRWRGAF